MLKITKEPEKTAKHVGFSYQVDAVAALKNLPYSGIFHEQGLGKTKIAIDLALAWLQEKTIDSILFVTKKGLVDNWTKEIRNHTFLTPRILSQDSQANFFAFNSPVRFYLMHYEVCKSEEKRLALFQKTRRVAIVCDEAQKFKNPLSQITLSLFRLSAGFVRKVILTGTPIANRPYDLWALIRFLDQGKALGVNFENFKAKLDLSHSLETDSDRRDEFEKELSAIRQKISAFTIRETKSSADIQLPTKELHYVSTHFAPQQQLIYNRYRTELSLEVIKQGRLVEDSAESILKRLLRLVQVASNPILVDESYTEEPGKLRFARNIVSDVIAEGGKLIIWTSFVDNANWLYNQFRAEGSIFVHGRMNMDLRNASIARFSKDPKCRILVATPGAAKEGLTLTMANHAIFYDRGFSLDDYLQAQDRIHRISQTKVCHIHNLIMKDSIDEWVDELLNAKSLAAQLANADISKDDYDLKAKYDFPSVLKKILGAD
jgi:SNF2 family DNA or RNA helicase